MSRSSDSARGAYALLIKIGAIAGAIVAVLTLWFLIFPRDHDGETARSGIIDRIEIDPVAIRYSQFVGGRDATEILQVAMAADEEALASAPVASAGLSLIAAVGGAEGDERAVASDPRDGGSEDVDTGGDGSTTTSTGEDTSTTAPSTTIGRPPRSGLGVPLASGQLVDVGSGTLQPSTAEGGVELHTPSGVVARHDLPRLSQVDGACGAFAGGVCIAIIPGPTTIQVRVDQMAIDASQIPVAAVLGGAGPDPLGHVITFSVELVGLRGRTAGVVTQTRDPATGRFAIASPDITLLTSEADRERASIDVFVVVPGGRATNVRLSLVTEDSDAALDARTVTVDG